MYAEHAIMRIIARWSLPAREEACQQAQCPYSPVALLFISLVDQTPLSAPVWLGLQVALLQSKALFDYPELRKQMGTRWAQA